MKAECDPVGGGGVPRVLSSVHVWDTARGGNGNEEGEHEKTQQRCMCAKKTQTRIKEPHVIVQLDEVEVVLASEQDKSVLPPLDERVTAPGAWFTATLRL